MENLRKIDYIKISKGDSYQYVDVSTVYNSN